MLISRALSVVCFSTAMAVAFALVATVPPMSATAQDERIIISGASGNLGGQTVKELLARGVPASRLILVSRTPEELKEYADQGASVRFGDFTKPESLPAAYAGGTRMLLISVGGSGEVTAAALSEARDRRGEGRRRQAHRLHVVRRHHARRCRGTRRRPPSDRGRIEGERPRLDDAAQLDLHARFDQSGRAHGRRRPRRDPTEREHDRLRDARGLRGRRRGRAVDAGAREQGLRHHGPRSCSACARRRPSRRPSPASRSRSCRAARTCGQASAGRR